MITVDFHTHILPGIDDGSPSVVESVRMIRQLVEQGVQTVFLTPHFYPQKDYPDVFLSNRAAALQELTNGLSQMDNPPRLVVGAEVNYSPGMSRWDNLSDLTLGNTGYILIEMPECKWSDRMFRELELVYLERKLIPVIAHVERCLSANGMRNFIDELMDMPILLQVNASFIYEKQTRRMACKLLNTNSIHLIGSDCHGSEWRAPNFGKAIDVISTHLKSGAIENLGELEMAVLSGRNIFVDNTNKK